MGVMIIYISDLACILEKRRKKIVYEIDIEIQNDDGNTEKVRKPENIKNDKVLTI